MIKVSNGKIKLDDRVIDLSTFSVRPKVTEQKLEQHYNSFINHAEEAADYFKDRAAFEKALTDASTDKKPKLVPKETKYPLWRTFLPFNFLNSSKRRMYDDFFVAAHCITRVRSKFQPDEQDKPLDEKLQEDIVKKFEQYPGYEGIIEVPDDRTQPETKATTFHESLHYLIIRYQAETGNSFVDAFIKEDLSPIERYKTEHMLHEATVEMLTDRLLIHDPDAQFENRWQHYSLNDDYRSLAMFFSAITTGLLIGSSFSVPLLLPLAIVPGRIRDYAIQKQKQLKKDKILKPVEYPVFKI